MGLDRPNLLPAALTFGAPSLPPRSSHPLSWALTLGL